MKEIKKYAEEWDVSAKHFYDNGYYCQCGEGARAPVYHCLRQYPLY